MLITGEAVRHVTLTSRVTVQHPERNSKGERPRFRVTQYEASVLINASAVSARVSPRDGSLYYLELIVPIQTYFRILKGVRSPEAPSNITRARQVRGARKWVTRLDRARTGHFRRDSTVFLGGDFLTPIPEGPTS